MFKKTAQFYDQIYSFKDYEEESQKIVNLIKKVNPSAQRILDVACGTGEHARHLAKDFQVDGIDIEPEFIRIAQEKMPTGHFRVADMCDFEMGERYDVVLCLFSSIGYLTKRKEVINALQCFKKHLKTGGVIMVEPWFTPEQFNSGAIHKVNVDEPDLKICRMSVSECEENLSKLNFHYLVGTPQGVEHFTEEHTLALYTLDEMLFFFAETGLSASYDPEGITGRGMYQAKIVKSEV